MGSMPGRSALAAAALMCAFLLAACSTAPTLRYITVAPTTATIDATTTQQFTATTYYSDGTRTAATATAAWSSSNTAVATVNASGVATGLTNGSSSITATFGGLSASASLTVARTLTSIAITPATATVAAGLTQQYTATGTYLLTGGTTMTMDITSIAGWTSSNMAVATIDSAQDATNGLATTLTAGTTLIAASLNGITSANATLTVGPAVVNALQITANPAATVGTASVAVGNTVTLTALELFTDGTTQALTGTATYSIASACSPAGAVVIEPSGTNGTEILSGQAIGTCTVTATEPASPTPNVGTTAVTVIAGTAQFGYIGNSGSNTISQFSVAAATAPYLTALSPATTGAVSPQQVILDPNGLYAYQIDSSAGSRVHIYDVAPAGSTTPATGALTIRTGDPNVVAGSGGPNIEVIDPTGRYLYVIDRTANTLFGFAISQADGTLTSISGLAPYTSSTINGPSDVLIDRTGQFLYIVNHGNATVSAFTIGAGGKLTAGASTPSGTAPAFATIDSVTPSAQILIVPGGDKTVSTYTIDPTSGALTQVGSATTVTAASALDNAVVDPTGAFLYLVDVGASATAPGQIYSFNIDSTGVIGAQIGTALPTDIGPGGIALDPTGALLAVDNKAANDISLYTAASGALTAVTPAVPVGTAPFGITFYVANQ
jgi:6-phosphogluconolactonase (cycloisomerase 2 family)